MKNKKSYIFAAVLIGMTAIFWLVALITRGATLNLYFVPDSNNTYMDYFHMLSNIEGGILTTKMRIILLFLL